MRVLAAILLLNIIVSCQQIEAGWKEIKPLKSEKAAVDKKLGTPTVNEIGYYYYKTNEAFIEVIFSTEPCKKERRGRGIYNIAKDTVISYTVNVKKELKLSDLAFARDKYRRIEDSELKDLVHYFNSDEGVQIATVKREGIEYVGQIRFNPSQKDTEKFKCKQRD
jgi:hypothetical protein